jgi:hypothetical protein
MKKKKQQMYAAIVRYTPKGEWARTPDHEDTFEEGMADFIDHIIFLVPYQCDNNKIAEDWYYAMYPVGYLWHVNWLHDLMAVPEGLDTE